VGETGHSDESPPPLHLVMSVRVPLNIGEKKANARSKARKGPRIQELLETEKAVWRGEHLAPHLVTYTMGKPKQPTKMAARDLC
jgi:hypothetical protein